MAIEKANNYWSPLYRILDRFKNEALQAYLVDIRTAVEEFRDNPTDLEKMLEELQGADMLHQLRDTVKLEYDLNDRLLGDLLNSLRSGLVQGDYERKYVIRQVCSNMLASSQEAFLDGEQFQTKDGRLIETGQRPDKRVQCDYVKTEEPRIKPDKYVLEREFREGTWTEHLAPKERWSDSRIITTCPKCEGRVTVWSTSNIILPASSDVVAYLASRLKSDGDVIEKLNDVICYDERDKKAKLRHLDDVLGFAVVLQDVDRARGAVRERIKEGFIKPNLDKKFLAYRGIHLPKEVNDLPLSAQLHYAMLCWMRQRLDKDSIAPVRKGLDDCIANPLQKYSKRGVVEDSWQGIRCRATYKGTPVEFHIKPISVARKEQDPHNVLWHESYAVRRKKEREEDWAKRGYPLIVWYALNNILRKSRGR